MLNQKSHAEVKDSELNERLLAAVKRHNSCVTKTYLNRGADPNATTPEGRPALHMAVACGREDLVRLLLDAGADPSRPNQKEQTPLHVAAARGDEDIIKLLLASGAEPSPLDWYNRTPLHIVSRSPDGEAMLALLKGGADPNAGNHPRSALHTAILGGYPSAVEMLIQHGADINAMGYADRYSVEKKGVFTFRRVASSVSPLGLALQQFDWDLSVPYLLECGASLNGLSTFCEEASAFEAVVLLNGYDLFLSEDDDNCPLKYLIKNGCVPSLEELKQRPQLEVQLDRFNRSLVAPLLQLTLDNSKPFDDVKSLYELLEEAGYHLRDDPFCKNIMEVVRGTPAGLSWLSSQTSGNLSHTPVNHTDRTSHTKSSSWEAKTAEPPRLTGYQLAQALEPFDRRHFVLEIQMYEEIVAYFSNLICSLAGPREVPKLSLLCRWRIRSHLLQVNKERALEKLVPKLPVPCVLQKFIMLELN